jgi:hypothetical protein
MDTIAARREWRFTSDRSRDAPISEAIMRAILSMALVLGTCDLGTAADEEATDPVGTWRWSYEIGEQKRTSTLTVKKEGDKFVGTMSWPDSAGVGEPPPGARALADDPIQDGRERRRLRQRHDRPEGQGARWA